MPHRPCLELLLHAEKRTRPPGWAAAQERIIAESRHLDRLLALDKPPAVYGANTLVGHLSDKPVSADRLEAFQAELLANHALGSAPYFEPREAVCIGYARAHFFSLGGSAITPELYKLVRTAVADPHFRPEVPRHCSYSCGDVIPAAHWALALSEYLKDTARYRLRRKEGIALINGAFVHVGIALSQVRPLFRTWHAFLLASRLNAHVCKANRSDCTAALTDDAADPIRAVCDLLRPEGAPRPRSNGTVQDPISVRALPQVAAALAGAITAYLDALDQALRRRSDNPLIVVDSDEPLSQGSFLAPMVTLAAGQLIESLLLALWAIERRTHHLLSGQVAGVPANASRAADELGLIQVPKLMTAILEEVRLKAGRRSYASGGSTSYGLEDLWSAGLETAETLAAVFAAAARLMAIELTVGAVCLTEFFPRDRSFAELLALLPRKGALARRFDEARDLLTTGKLASGDALELFAGHKP